MAAHHDDLDWAAMGPVLERGAEVHLPMFLQAARWVRSVAVAVDRIEPPQEPRLVVDVGAGPGVVACVLAETFRSARVIAVDGSPELVELAVSRAARLGLGDRVVTQVAELPDGLGVVGVHAAADIGWTSHVLHHVGNQQAAIERVAELVRPGGLLAVVEGGLPTRTLPRDIGIGRPGLEARLDVANAAWFAAMRADLPGAVAVVEHWPGLLTGAGLELVGSRTFVLDRPAPLDASAREFVEHRFATSREHLDEWLETEDRATLDLLLDAASPQSLHQRDDVFVLSASTVHLGRAR